ncbi:MAG: cupin domain-containing protein [Actinomycetota bacterium]
MPEVTLFRSADRTDWAALVDPPGRLLSPGREIDAFTSGDKAFTCGLWEREPDTWSFERPYDEVAYILEGSADVETEDGRVLHVGAGDIFVTPNGSKGRWRVHETIAKFFAIYSGGAIGDTTMRVIGANDRVEWITLENAPGDEDPPGQEWYAWRNPDAKFSTGVWRREPETGSFERTYHEVACVIEGDVEIETQDGRVLRAGAGDVLVTPQGSEGVWRALNPVKKFWAVHHE